MTIKELEKNQKQAFKTKIIGMAIVFCFCISTLALLRMPVFKFFNSWPFLLIPYGIVFILPYIFFIFFRLRPAVTEPRFLIALLIFLSTIILSTPWSYFPATTIVQSFLTVILALHFYFLVLMDPNPVKTFAYLAKSLAFLGAIMSAIALFLLFFGKVDVLGGGRYLFQAISMGTTTLYQSIHVSPVFFRISSLFGNPNFFASWLMITLPMSLYCFISFHKKAVWFFLLFLQATALMLTLSRAGILSGSLALFLIFCLLKKYKNLKKSTAFLVLFLIVAMILFLFFFPLSCFRHNRPGGPF